MSIVAANAVKVHAEGPTAFNARIAMCDGTASSSGIASNVALAKVAVAVVMPPSRV